MTGTCDICPEPAVASLPGITGPFKACAAHRPYLRTWQRSERQEAEADSRAARDFEDAAYGRDY